MLNLDILNGYSYPYSTKAHAIYHVIIFRKILSESFIFIYLYITLESLKPLYQIPV